MTGSAPTVAALLDDRPGRVDVEVQLCIAWVDERQVPDVSRPQPHVDLSDQSTHRVADQDVPLLDLDGRQQPSQLVSRPRSESGST